MFFFNSLFCYRNNFFEFFRFRFKKIYLNNKNIKYINWLLHAAWFFFDKIYRNLNLQFVYIFQMTLPMKLIFPVLTNNSGFVPVPIVKHSIVCAYKILVLFYDFTINCNAILPGQ